MLSVGIQEFTKAVNAAGSWRMDVTAAIKTSAGLQGFTIWLEHEGSKLIAPLCAKKYTILRETRPWYSVSERILEAARRFGNGVVFTFISQFQEVRVTLANGARAEGEYLRFGERYSGWYVDETLTLKQWLSDPTRLNYQEQLL